MSPSTRLCQKGEYSCDWSRLAGDVPGWLCSDWASDTLSGFHQQGTEAGSQCTRAGKTKIFGYRTQWPAVGFLLWHTDKPSVTEKILVKFGLYEGHFCKMSFIVESLKRGFSRKLFPFSSNFIMNLVDHTLYGVFTKMKLFNNCLLSIFLLKLNISNYLLR